MPQRAPSPLLAAHVGAVAVLFALTSCATTVGSDTAGTSESDPEGSHQLTGQAVAGHCRGRIGGVSVDGDVTVPNGATCELDGTRVEGNISVGHGARVYARGVDVDGDLEGESTTAVEVTDGSVIGGNVQLESGGSAVVSDTHIDGDLSWEEQRGALVADSSTIRGNLEVDGNSGGVTITDNQIVGDLSCDENNPAPHGAGNTTSGDEDDQCRGL